MEFDKSLLQKYGTPRGSQAITHSDQQGGRRRNRVVGIENNRVVLRQLRALFREGTTGDLTDGQLLERFATNRGELAEQAFTALVERHGPMVLRVCRGVLGDSHDAQDAFQATFLVLVKKAPTLWIRDSLGPWLHQVAFRTASYSRKSAARRRRHERTAATSATATYFEVPDELGRLLHEEIDRLPERFRAPLVLCDLEGRTHEQAARHLGWPVGTVKSRQSRARERLRERLLRRGVGPGAGLIAPTALVPPSMTESTTHAVLQYVAARTLLRGSAMALSQEVLRSMILTQCMKVASVVVVVGAAGFGVELLAQRGSSLVAARAQARASAERSGDRPVQEVKAGKLSFRIIERGSLEASQVHEAHSPVTGMTTIESIVPEGTRVKKGQLVCELNSTNSKKQLINQEITTKSAEANWQNAKLEREVAEIAVTEYTEGILKSERATLKNQIALAGAAIDRGQARLERIRNAKKRVEEAMAKPVGATTSPADIVAELDVNERLDTAEQSIQSEQAKLDDVRSRQERLEKYTVNKTLRELHGEVERTRRIELMKHATWELEKAKEAKLREQVEQCKIYAPFDGYIAYGPSHDGHDIDKLTSVAQGQLIFWIWDLNAPMLVNAKIHESIVHNLTPGQRAKITVDAFADEEFTGVVKSVAGKPDVPSAFRANNKRSYTALVDVEKGIPGLRPGMTAKVDILVGERENVLTVPVQAVVTFDRKDHVAIKKKDGSVELREVTLGLANDKDVEVKTGLEAGEVVELNPLALMSETERRLKFLSPPRPTEPAAAKTSSP